MAENKKGFILYADYISVIEKLPNEIAGKLFKIILDYVNDKNPIVDDLLLQIAFEPIKLQLKRDLKEWENKCIERSESGRLGGIKSGKSRRIKKQNEANEAQLQKTKQNEANEADNDNVNDNVNERDKIKTSITDILFAFDKEQWLLLTEDEKKERSQLLIDEMKNSYNWQLKVRRLFNFDEKKIKDEIRLFMMERDAKNELWKDINDLKSYFISKLNLKYNK